MKNKKHQLYISYIKYKLLRAYKVIYVIGIMKNFKNNYMLYEKTSFEERLCQKNLNRLFASLYYDYVELNTLAI